jgi:hypothetical protein
MSQSKFDIENIKKYLPYNYLTLVSAKIGNVISVRHIQYILNGERNDNYGVIEIVLEMAEEEKARLKAIAKRVEKLK